MSDSMKIRWPDTILKEREQYSWIEANLFPVDFLEPVAFEATEELYRFEFPPMHLLEFVVFGSPNPARFSKAELNSAIMEACDAIGYTLDAYWWTVNVHDNIARIVERVGIYSFCDPLEPLLIQLGYNPADEGGTSYAGLLDCKYQWALSLEYGNAFVIQVHGPSAFCRRVAAAVRKTDQALPRVTPE